MTCQQIRSNAADLSATGDQQITVNICGNVVMETSPAVCASLVVPVKVRTSRVFSDLQTYQHNLGFVKVQAQKSLFYGLMIAVSDLCQPRLMSRKHLKNQGTNI